MSTFSAYLSFKAIFLNLCSISPPQPFFFISKEQCRKHSGNVSRLHIFSWKQMNENSLYSNVIRSEVPSPHVLAGRFIHRQAKTDAGASQS